MIAEYELAVVRDQVPQRGDDSPFRFLRFGFRCRRGGLVIRALRRERRKALATVRQTLDDHAPIAHLGPVNQDFPAEQGAP